jgi:predicted secreted hydrolase
MARWLMLLAALCHPGWAADYPPVIQGTALVFPRDHGAHPAYRTEWWYVTGWLEAGEERSPLGFQVTFFRVRPPGGHANPSRFAPRQILFAHAALADPASGRLIAGERAERSGFDLAGAEEGRTRVWIGDWSLAGQGERYRAQVRADRFELDLRLESTQPVLPQGRDGYSRKAEDAKHGSYYYSLPQLRVEGEVAFGGRRVNVRGSAWLDHEWSSELMPPAAVGWDWAGMNLDGGGALMVFRMRDNQGRTLWAGGTIRTPGRAAQILEPEQIEFRPVRRWRSPRTGIEYPVSVIVKAGDRTLELRPLMDDQELDSRRSTGAIYWEGAVRAYEGERVVGRGYLELTGYGERLRM